MIAYPVTSRPVDSDLETSTQRIKHASYGLTQQIAAQVLLLKALHRRRQNLAAALNSRNDLLDECRRTSALLKRDIGAELNRSRHLQQQVLAFGAACFIFDGVWLTVMSRVLEDLACWNWSSCRRRCSCPEHAVACLQRATRPSHAVGWGIHRDHRCRSGRRRCGACFCYENTSRTTTPCEPRPCSTAAARLLRRAPVPLADHRNRNVVRHRHVDCNLGLRLPLARPPSTITLFTTGGVPPILTHIDAIRSASTARTPLPGAAAARKVDSQGPATQSCSCSNGAHELPYSPCRVVTFLVCAQSQAASSVMRSGVVERVTRLCKAGLLGDAESALWQCIPESAAYEVVLDGYARRRLPDKCGFIVEQMRARSIPVSVKALVSVCRANRFSPSSWKSPLLDLAASPCSASTFARASGPVIMEIVRRREFAQLAAIIDTLYDRFGRVVSPGAHLALTLHETRRSSRACEQCVHRMLRHGLDVHPSAFRYLLLSYAAPDQRAGTSVDVIMGAWSALLNRCEHRPQTRDYIAVLRALARADCVALSRSILMRAVTSNGDVVVSGALFLPFLGLVSRLGFIGFVQDIVGVFDAVGEQTSILTCNIILQAYARSGNRERCRYLFRLLSSSSSLRPDARTYAIMLEVAESVDEGRQYLESAQRLAAGDVVYCTWMRTLIRLGETGEAMRVFTRDLPGAGLRPNHYAVAAFVEANLALYPSTRIEDLVTRLACSSTGASESDVVDGCVLGCCKAKQGEACIRVIEFAKRVRVGEITSRTLSPALELFLREGHYHAARGILQEMGERRLLPSGRAAVMMYNLRQQKRSTGRSPANCSP